MKKNITKIICFIAALGFNFLGASGDSDKRIEISGRDEVFIPERLGDIKLYRDCDGFHVIKDDRIKDVQNCWCDSILLKMTDEQLIAFLGKNKPPIIILTPEEFEHIDKNDIIEITEEEKNELLGKLFGGGCIRVTQMSDGQYRLRANIRLLGGIGTLEVVGLAACVVLCVAGGAAAGFYGIQAIAGGLANAGLVTHAATAAGAAASATATATGATTAAAAGVAASTGVITAVGASVAGAAAAATAQIAATAAVTTIAATGVTVTTAVAAGAASAAATAAVAAGTTATAANIGVWVGAGLGAYYSSDVHDYLNQGQPDVNSQHTAPVDIPPQRKPRRDLPELKIPLTMPQESAV
jgi:hypothetical protein